MFIITKQSPGGSNRILNVFYYDNLTIIRNWVKQYIETEIQSLQYCPALKDTKYITYELNDGGNTFELLKKYKRVNKGYVYNSAERITDVVYTISILHFDSNFCDLQASCMLNDINTQINSRVLKQLDKESLIQIFTSVQNRINSKTHWNRAEYIGAVGDALQQFKKELYSSVAKRMKRFGKRSNIKKTN